MSYTVQEKLRADYWIVSVQGRDYDGDDGLESIQKIRPEEGKHSFMNRLG